MGKKHFGVFQTAETGNRALNSSVKGSGANHYTRVIDKHSMVRESVKDDGELLKGHGEALNLIGICQRAAERHYHNAHHVHKYL